MFAVQKEQDTFPTVYKKDYIWHKTQPDHKLFTANDAYALSKLEQKAFFDPNAIKEMPWEEQLAIIKDLYAQRMKTTYFKSYCEGVELKPSEKKEDALDSDTLLDTAERLFSAKTQPVLQPVATSRRVMGYCRPAYYYMGLSEYQDEYSRAGLGQLAAKRGSRLKARLSFCDQFKL